MNSNTLEIVAEFDRLESDDMPEVVRELAELTVAITAGEQVAELIPDMASFMSNDEARDFTLGLLTRVVSADVIYFLQYLLNVGYFDEQ